MAVQTEGVIPTPATVVDDLELVADQCEREIEDAERRKGDAEVALDLVRDAIRAVKAIPSPGVEAQNPPASPPPSEPADSNSAGAKEPPAPPSSPSIQPSPSRAIGSKQEQARRKGDAVDAVVDAAAELGGRVGKGAILRETNLSNHQVTEAIAEAVRAGRLEKVGKGAGTRYVAPEIRMPVTPPAKRGKPGPATEPPKGTERSPRQAPTLAGRILTRCQIPMSSVSLASALQESIDAVNHEVTKLMREGDLRTQRKNGEILYSTVMA